ncbi:LOW QUALITY PROTEIN: hypothetical protein HID58_058666 [Brassica napus]|uniref:Uncharacterized protein n=1 Tax=Brassica napus TaxID=3708 RepID=A0ABQ7ZQN9_BRANA|nr:LOW QUALITY PROTEIN: hypothetical protein HID58_058666 [Brassica napus]
MKQSQVSTPLQSYSLWFILPVALSFTTAYQGSQRTLDSHTNQPFRCYQHLCAANASPADPISPDPFSSKEKDPFSLDPFSSRDSEMAEQRRWQGGRWRRTCSSASGPPEETEEKADGGGPSFSPLRRRRQRKMKRKRKRKTVLADPELLPPASPLILSDAAAAAAHLAALTEKTI